MQLILEEGKPKQIILIITNKVFKDTASQLIPTLFSFIIFGFVDKFTFEHQTGRHSVEKFRKYKNTKFLVLRVELIFNSSKTNCNVGSFL